MYKKQTNKKKTFKSTKFYFGSNCTVLTYRPQLPKYTWFFFLKIHALLCEKCVKMSYLCIDTESEKKKFHEVYFGARHILHPSSVEISLEVFVKSCRKKNPHTNVLNINSLVEVINKNITRTKQIKTTLSRIALNVFFPKFITYC